MHMSVLRFAIRNCYLAVAFLVLVFIAAYYPSRATASAKAGEARKSASGEIVEVAQAPTIPDSDTRNQAVLKLARGQSLSGLLTSADYSAAVVFDVVDSLGQVLDMKRILAGQEVLVRSSREGWIEEVELKVSFDRTVRTKYDGDDWLIEEDITNTYSIPTLSIATIETSLFEAARSNKVPAPVVMRAIELFSFNVDFQRDIKPGDKLITLYEKIYSHDNKYMIAGDLIYARLETDAKNVEFWQYTRLDGETDYYELDGRSVQRTLLKTPVDSVRISSGFGYRKIPTLNFEGLHRGIDFAVRSGTPVMAAGDGRVLIAGWHNTYGLRVKLSHANHYDTMYAHFSKIAAGVYAGAPVSQGQVIGYVGSTGLSTGPHCHYEVHYYGTPVNPTKLQFPPEHQLDSEDIVVLNSKIAALSNHFGL